MEITPLNCFILLSAIWRLSSLFANENGPLDVFERIRRGVLRLRAKSHALRAVLASFYEGLRCEWCNSIWFAVPMVAAWWYFGKVVLLVVLPLALSAWVIAFKYVLHLIRNAEEYYAEQVTLFRFMSAREQEEKTLKEYSYKEWFQIGQKKGKIENG